LVAQGEDVVSAEILALLLIALILERETIRDLKGWLRLEYALILLAGEVRRSRGSRTSFKSQAPGLKGRFSFLRRAP
jgi:hypothetical protein